MKSTLEQYIDPENIPKKYGGTLDFEFGMMPVLEPAILENLKWYNPSDQNGVKTIPSGPLRFTDSVTSKDEQDLVALGTNKGAPRKQIVASTTMKLPRASQAIDEVTHRVRNFGLQRTHTTDGRATQPTEEGDLYYGSDLKSPSDSNSGSATPNPTPSTSDAPNPSSTPIPPTMTDAEANNTHQVANGEPTVPASAPNADPAATVQPVTSGSSGRTGEQPRVGTSATRQEDQRDTHAEGKLEEGTPAVVDHGHGDRTVTMEPKTVGQAPKENPLPPVEREEPGMLDKAKAAAGTVYDQGVAVAGSVGLVKTEEQVQKEKEEGAAKKEQEAEQHRKEVDDPKVNEISDERVEAFLQSGMGSEQPKVE